MASCSTARKRNPGGPRIACAYRQALTRGVPPRSPLLPDCRASHWRNRPVVQEGRAMRRIVVCLVVAALSVAVPAGVAADPTSICPDQMYLVPVSAVQSGPAKDKNGNGLVCAKYT